MANDHTFFDVVLSAHHYVSPFSCICDGENDYNLHEAHSLNFWQKITALALAVLVGVATKGIGAIPAFYLITAALKARNCTWERYPQKNEKFYVFVPEYWGISSTTFIRTSYDYQYKQYTTSPTSYRSPYVERGENRSRGATPYQSPYKACGGGGHFGRDYGR